MNVYDVLRHLVITNTHWVNEGDQRAALEAVDEAERWQVFGKQALFAQRAIEEREGG